MTGLRWHKLSNFSAYSRPDPRICQQTVHGGLVTAVGVVLALMLLIAEIKQCMTIRRVQEFKVDTTRGERLHLTFNLTFPALPCELLMLDVQDVAGTFEVDNSLKRAHAGEVHKFQLDSKGKRVRMKEYISPKGRSANPHVIMVDRNDVNSMVSALERKDGCSVYGWLEVPRVAGALHFSVRPEARVLEQYRQEKASDMPPQDTSFEVSKLNMGHSVQTFHFGPRFPGQGNPLEDLSRYDRMATGIDKYFIKVVTTDYTSLYGWRLHTYQYSLTEYHHKIQDFFNELPGVYFLYDMSPIMVELRDTRPGLLRLVVRLCAVVGGVFAVTGLWDRLVHALVTSITKRR